jgi:hypothetical protein
MKSKKTILQSIVQQGSGFLTARMALRRQVIYILALNQLVYLCSCQKSPFSGDNSGRGNPYVTEKETQQTYVSRDHRRPMVIANFPTSKCPRQAEQLGRVIKSACEYGVHHHREGGWGRDGTGTGM